MKWASIRGFLHPRQRNTMCPWVVDSRSSPSIGLTVPPVHEEHTSGDRAPVEVTLATTSLQGPGLASHQQVSLVNAWKFLMLQLRDTAGGEAPRGGQGEAMKVRAIGYLGLLSISSKEGRTMLEWKSKLYQTTCHHLPNSPYHQLLQEEPRQHCLHGLFQVTKIQAVPLQNRMCFLLP